MTAEDTSEIAISADSISYSYGEKAAVDGVSFEVSRGEVLGILGPNGAGKSTTIRLLTGQLVAAGGTVEILGLPVPAQREGVQARIGVCFEEQNLYPSLTPRENLDFFAQLFGVKDFAADALLARVGLDGRADERVAALPIGMQQRLMLARALVNSPEVLFLDEPTDGLDPLSAGAIRAVIRAEADRGAAVLLATRDKREAEALCDRVAFINDGTVLAIDTPEALKRSGSARAVKLRYRHGDGIETKEVPLDGPSAGERLRWLVSRPGLLSIHTEETTLEDAFVELAGRRLD